MKGLLHRLADRAAGVALRVRSDARLPFRDGLTRFGESERAARDRVGKSLSETVADGRDAVPPTGLELLRANAASMDASIEASGESPGTRSRPRGRPGVEISDATLAPTERSAPHRSASERHEARSANVEPHVRETAPVMTASTTGTDVRDPRPPASATFEPNRRQPAAASAHVPDGSSRRTRSSVPFDLPLLMPSAHIRARASMAAVGEAAPPLASPARGLDDTTEVHVRIGRIDVTAVHETPAPRKQPKREQTPVSLDAYLETRTKA